MKPTNSYLLFKNFHIAEITELHPESIKNSAKRTKTDREKISHSTKLNHIAKSLGFSEGFASYEKLYKSQLLPFLSKHGLKTRADLCRFRNKGWSLPLTPLNRQQISERLFFNSARLPEKLFTGYDFPFSTTLSDGNRLVMLGEGGQECNDLLRKLGLKSTLDILPPNVYHNLKVAKSNKELRLPSSQFNDFSNRTIEDAVLGAYLPYCNAAFNILGDTLVEPSIYGHECQQYYQNDFHDKEQHAKALAELVDVFSSRLRKSTKGWIEVIPFNERLIFLKGRNGEYDFLYRNMRGKGFKHEFHDGKVKLLDLPSFIDKYHFERWLYFEYEGCRELDEHNAEILYYNSGSNSRNWHDSDILEAFYVENEVYTPKKTKRSNLRLPGFTTVPLKDKNLNISNLISIEDFAEFQKENAEYFGYRNSAIDNQLEIDNQDQDLSLPVSCTWYDALVYVSWLEKKINVPFRLLSMAEYKEIRENTAVLPSVRPIKSELIPAEKGWNAKLFPTSLKKTSLGSLEFILSSNFAEWLREEYSIRSGCLRSFHGNDVYAGCPLDSTGAYKELKTGFRVCYELETDKEVNNG